MEDGLKLEYTDDAVFLVLGETELELSLHEAESLFVVLGRALADIRGGVEDEPKIITGRA